MKKLTKKMKIKREVWNVWDIEKITKDFKITIRIEQKEK